MKKLLLSILITAICLSLSCEGEETPTNIIEKNVINDPEAIVRSNALYLESAVNAFLEEGLPESIIRYRYGVFPKNAYTDTTVNGNTLIDFLPGGEPLLNPYTGLRDQPVDTIAANPGEIGYQPSYSYSYCTITGFGDSTQIININYAEELEEEVVVNCYIVMSAADAFAMDNEGYYPDDCTMVNDSSKTILDYLPDGMLVENPFTRQRTEPAIWGSIAANSGQIGYEPIFISGYIVGCKVTGGDRDGNVMIALTRIP